MHLLLVKVGSTLTMSAGIFLSETARTFSHCSQAGSTANSIRYNRNSITSFSSLAHSTTSVARDVVVCRFQATSGHCRRGDLVVRRAKFQGFKQQPAGADSPLFEEDGAAVNGAVVSAEQAGEAAVEEQESDARDDEYVLRMFMTIPWGRFIVSRTSVQLGCIPSCTHFAIPTPWRVHLSPSSPTLCSAWGYSAVIHYARGPGS